MKVITTNRDVIYSNACGCSGADGELTSNFTAEEKRAMFQKWYNLNKLDRNVVLREGLKMAGGLRTDGVKDDKTTAAYKKFGEEYEKTLGGGIKDTRPTTPLPKPTSPSNMGIYKDEPKKSTLDTITGLFTKDETNPPVSATKTKTAEEEKAEKKKKMIKIALIAGGAIALTTIVILIARRKK